jgi:cholest-4-en-3-one 26-monooxygenase
VSCHGWEREEHVVNLRLDRPDLSDPDLFVERLPHEVFARLRREASVARHEDVVAANRDVAGLSAEQGIMMFDQPDLHAADAPRMMIEMDPPRHTRYRLLVNKGFTPRMIGRLEDHMRAVTRRIIDRVSPDGHCDFVTDVASELPLQVIAELMSVPVDHRAELFQWSNQIIGPAATSGEAGGPAYEPMAKMYAYANELAAERRGHLAAADSPSEILDVLLNAEVDGARLSEREFDLFFLLLFVAGTETTRTAIAQGMLAFFDHPDQWVRVRENRALLPSAVEEILRWSTPILHFRRTATRDLELGGQTIHRGDKVLLWFVSANYDGEVFADPVRFDIGRDPNPHVTFGAGGPHFCLGANLARLEIRVMFDEILDELPDIQLAGPPARLRSNFTNGLTQLPVRFAPRRSR